MKILKSKSTVAAIVVVAAVVAGALWLLRDEPGRLLAETIESRGSRLLGTRVDVADLSYSRESGELTAAGLEVANPSGFSDRNMLQVEAVEGRVDLGGRVVKRFSLDGVRALIEFRGASNNFEAVGERVTEEDDAGGDSGEPEQTEEAMSEEEETANGGDGEAGADDWLFERVAFSDIQVTVRADWTSDVVEFTTDDFELENVQGATEDVARRAVSVFLGRVLETAARRASDERMSGNLRERAEELLDRAGESQ